MSARFPRGPHQVIQEMTRNSRVPAPAGTANLRDKPARPKVQKKGAKTGMKLPGWCGPYRPSHQLPHTTLATHNASGGPPPSVKPRAKIETHPRPVSPRDFVPNPSDWDALEKEDEEAAARLAAAQKLGQTLPEARS